MSEPKPREPFKSGVTDFDALNRRVKELGIRPIVGDQNGVDVTPKPAAPTPTEPGHYDAGYY